jgi:tetratricopeptide (TPR) repeat protein
MPRWRFWLWLGVLVCVGVGCYVFAVRLWAWGRHAAAERALRHRDFVRAHACLVDYLSVRGNDAATLFLAAQTARRAGLQARLLDVQPDLRDEARRHLEDCARLGWPEESIALERLLLAAQQGELASSEASLLSFLEVDHPDVSLILEALVQGYLRNFQHDKARSSVTRLLGRQPDNVQGLVWRGWLAEQMGELRTARVDFERALELDSAFDEARLCLASNLLQDQQAKEAVRHFHLLDHKLPGNRAVRLGLALCQSELGENEEARALFDAWLEDAPLDHPRRVQALVGRAKLALTLGDFDGAEHWACQALQKAPKDQDALHCQYQGLTARGQDETAKRIRAQLDRLQEEQKHLDGTLRRVYDFPNDPALRHDIGQTYLNLGREEQALIWFVSALERNPTYRPTLTALADYYERQGDAPRTIHFRQRASVAPSMQ